MSPSSGRPEASRIVQFGVFELDLDTRRLRKSGVRIKLQTKSFQILEALLEQPGKIVSREDLYRRLWQGEKFGAFDTGLNTAVNRLRLALGDSAENARYIETVARIGYRFIAPLTGSASNGVTIEPALTVRPPDGGERRIGVPWILTATLIAALLGAALWYFWPKPNPSFRQITFKRGNVWGARFTPDGQSVLYAAEWEGRPRAVFQTLPASPESRNLGFAGASLAAVSSRGELALLASGGTMNITGGTLSRVPLNGGAPLEIGRNVMSAEWSPDGESLVVVRAVQGRNLLEFPIGKVLYRTSGWIGSARMSTDGRSIAFIQHPVRHDDAGDITVIDTAGKTRGVSPGWDNAAGLAWQPRTGEIWFTAARKGSQRSVWAYRPGGRLRLVGQGPGILTLRDIARDGRVLLSRDIRRLEMAGRVGADLQERTLTWLDWSRVQEVSPDGGLVLFDESGEGAGAQSVAYVYKTAESSAVRLGEGRVMGFAPDMRHVLTLGAADRTHFRLMSIDGAGVLDAPKTGLDYQWGRFFPDGKRLLALASEPGQGLRLYVQSLDGASLPPTPITPPGAVRNVAISPDGDEIAVLTSNGNLTIYPVTPGQARVIASAEPLAPVHWSRDKKHVFVEHLRAYSDLPARVSRIDVRTGRLELWRDIEPADRMGVTSVTGVAISADERSYVYSFRRMLSELYVVEGWK